MAVQTNIPSEAFAELSAPSEAPVQAGGFSLVADRYEYAHGGAVTIPINRDGNPMSPYEAETGVKLPIVANLHNEVQDRHHTDFYRIVFTTASRGQRAMRYSRLQTTAMLAHAFYHKHIFGSELIESEDDQYRQVVLNCAGYIPAYGIVPNRSEFRLIELSTQQRDALRHPGVITTEREPYAQALIGQFLMYYAIKRGYSKQKIKDVEDFLEISEEMMLNNPALRQRKMALAEKLANRAIGAAVGPIENGFQQAKQNAALRENAPPTAWSVVKKWVQGYEPDYISTWEKVLDRSRRPVAA